MTLFVNCCDALERYVLPVHSRAACAATKNGYNGSSRDALLTLCDSESLPSGHSHGYPANAIWTPKMLSHKHL
jgi:hypothetical protein